MLFSAMVIVPLTLSMLILFFSICSLMMSELSSAKSNITSSPLNSLIKGMVYPFPS